MFRRKKDAEELSCGFEVNLKEKGGLLHLMTLISEKKGDYRSALEYAVEYSDVVDRLREQEKEESVIEIEQRYRNRELALSNRNLQKQNRYQLVIASLLVVILAGIIVWGIRLRKRMVEKKNRELEAYACFVESLKDDNEKLKTLRDSLAVRLNEQEEKEKRLKDSLEKRLTEVKELLETATLYEHKPEKFLEKFKQKARRISDSSYFMDLHEITDNRFCGLATYLKQAHPNLSNDDLDLCCLICFGFNASEINMIYGFSNVDTIYIKRHRLRKKMGLSSGLNMETYIKQVVSTLERERNRLKNNAIA